MGQALLVPSKKKFSISSLEPALHLDASRGIGTTGARSFSRARLESFAFTSNLNPGTDSFWVSFWVKPAAVTAATQFTDIITGGTGTGVSGFWVNRYADYIRTYFNDNSGGSTVIGVHSDMTFTAGKWYHIVVQFNRTAGTVTLWRDTVASSTVSDISSKTGPCSASGSVVNGIGGYAGNHCEDGSLSRMAYGTGILTADDVAELYNQGNGKFYAEVSAALDAKVVHYWNLNESSLSNAIDAKGTNDGAISGGNLLTNPGFETVTGDDFTGWSEPATLPATVTDGTSNARTGSHCACLTSPAGEYCAVVASPAPCVAGRAYTASFYAKAVGGTGNVQIDEAGSPSTYSPGVTYGQKTVTYTPSLTNFTLKRNSAGTFYIDDVSVTSAQIDSAAGPREATAADIQGGYHGVLTNMDTVGAWSTDTPDGSYTATKVDNAQSTRALAAAPAGTPVISPYGVAIGTTGNISAGASPYTRDFLNAYNVSRIRQDGTLKTVRMWCAFVGVITDLRIKVWRANGATFDLVGKSANLVGQLGAGGTVTLTVDIPGCRAGDYTGIFVTATTADNIFAAVTAAAGGTEKLWYTTGEQMPDTGANFTSKSQIAYTIPMHCTMDSPPIAVIGDSIIAGHPAHYTMLENSATEDADGHVGYFLQTALSKTVHNLGIGSQTSANILARFDADVIALSPNACVILAGVNDIATSVAQSTYEANMKSMVSKCLANGIRPFVVKIIPWTNGTTGQMQTRDAWNRFLATLPASYEGTVIVDAETALGQFRTGGDAGNLWDIKTAYNADGVHLNAAGYSALATAIATSITANSTAGTELSAYPGTMTGFADIDAAHVDGPDGSWGPCIPDAGSSPSDAWLLSSVNDSRSASVPSSLNTRVWDEAYTEPTATGSRSFAAASNQRFALANFPSLGTSDFALEAWVYRTSNAATGAIFGFGASSAGNPGIMLVSEGSVTTLRAYIADADSTVNVITPSGSCNLYTWNHVVVNVNRGTNALGVWVNGALVSTLDISTITGSLTPSGDFKAIGSYRNTDAAYPWDGGISRMRIYLGDALTAAEIAETYNGGKGRALDELSTALAAKVDHSWALDEAGNSNAVDSVGGNTGTQAGTSTNIASGPSPYLPAYDATLTGFTSSPRSSDVPAVLVGKCKSLQGADGKYATTGVKTVTGMGARSFSFWVKRDTTPASNETIFGDASVSATTVGACVQWATTNRIVITIQNGSALIISSASFYSPVLSLGEWHHVAFTWDGTTNANAVKMYIDNAVPSGNTLTTATATSQGAASTYSLQLIGFNATGGTEFQGLLCRPQIFAGRALTAGEVATLYAGGDVTEGLTAEWRFNEPDTITVPFEHALMGNNTNTAVECGSEVIGTAACTVSAMVYITGWGTAGRLCDNRKFNIQLQTNVLRMTNDDVVALDTVSDTAFATGAWYHLAVTRDAVGHTQMFINGNRKPLQSSKTINAGTPTAGTTNLFIANRNAVDRTFNGLIGQVRIDSGVLTQAQIRQLALGQSPATPTHDYTFDTPLDLPYLDGCRAVRFDGVDDRVATGSPNVIGTGALTITGWMNPFSSGASGGRIIDNGNTIFLVGNTGVFTFSSNNAANLCASSSNAYSLGVWQHVAVTRDAAGLATLYINGVLTGTADTNSGTPLAGAANTNIGNRNAADRAFDGLLTDVRVYDGIRLTQSQIRSLIAGTDFTTGLTARWKFGETPRSIPSCAGGMSLTFDGVDDYINCGTSLSGTGSASMFAWVKPKAYSGGDCIMSFSGWNHTLRISTLGKLLAFVNAIPTDGQATSNESVPIGEWSHVGVVYDDDGTRIPKLYLNGVECTYSLSVASVGTIVANSAFQIGVVDTSFFDGKIDDPRFYSSVVSASDIALLAVGGEPTTNPVAHWPFDDGPQYGEPSNGDPICVWEDRSGINFVQANTVNRPTFLQSGANGRPGITFDGVQQFFSQSNWNPNDPYGTLVVVAKHSDVTGVQAYVSSSDIGTDTSYMTFGTVASTGKARIEQRNAADTADLIPSTNGVGTTNARVISFRSDGSAHSIRIDGVAETASATSGANNGDWFSDTTLRDNVAIGAKDASTDASFLAGTIYEILYFPRPLSDVELRKVERILGSKYGVTIA